MANEDAPEEDRPEQTPDTRIEKTDIPDQSNTENIVSVEEDNGNVVVNQEKQSKFRVERLLPPFIRRRLGKQARPVTVLLLALFIVIIGGLSYWRFGLNNSKPSVINSSFKLKVVPFKLVSTIPAKGATNVNTSSEIVLNFNQPVTAAKMINNMFLTPVVNGKYEEGKGPDQIIFKPDQPFPQGTKVSVMINGTFASNQGSLLGTPTLYKFRTSIPGNSIVFQDQNGLIDQLTSMQSGQTVNYTLLFGPNVGKTASVALYKGDVSDLLSSLVYTKTGSSSYNFPQFNDLAVSTSGLTQITSKTGLVNNSTFNVKEPDGLYVLVATNSSGKEVGMVWIDFANFGVLLRQDDQKIILDAQSFASSQDQAANVSFYNLNGSVNLLKEQNVNGLTTINFPYNPSVDVAVAKSANETAIIPINILDSGGDIRVDQNLSTAQQAYAVTNKPTYKVGGIVKFAGYVRNDNDAQYVNPGGGTVKVYVATYKGGTPLYSITLPVDSNGMFSGSFQPNSSWLTSGDAFDQFQLFLAAPDGNPVNDIPLSSFSLTPGVNASDSVKVSFNQSQYLPNDKIVAQITATNSSGQPLSNQQVEVHIYSQNYYENNPSANLENFGYVGNELPGSPKTITLNSQGQATYAIDPSILPSDGSSQLVNIQASMPGVSGVGAAGGATAIVHQGDAVINLGLGRTMVPVGSDLKTTIYVNTLSGSPMGAEGVNYVLTDTNTSSVLAKGSLTTGSNGQAVLDIPSSELSSKDGMQLTLSAKDQYGNIVNATGYYSVQDSSTIGNFDTSSQGLFNLNVSGSSGVVKIGDTVNLTINSPSAIRTLVSMDRGRVYDPQMLSLKPGANSFSFNVTSNMAPSFALTFNYFLNGVYHSEGVNFTVNNPSKLANISVSGLSSSVKANQPLTLTLNTTDSNGNPLQSNLIVDVVSANAYDLSRSVNPNMFNVLYNPRPIMTSSSSSLSPIGSGGGRCGGGGGQLPSFAAAIGNTLYWDPSLSTNTSGSASISFNPPKGNWIVNVYSMSSGTQVAQKQIEFTAN